MAQKVMLSVGAISALTKGEHVGTPILQMMSSRRIPGEPERHRLMLSDGQYLNSSIILGSQLVHLLHENQLTNNSVIQMNKYGFTNRNGKVIISLQDLTVMKPGSEMQKIGNPVPVTSGGAAPAASAPAPAPAPAYGNGAPPAALSRPAVGGNTAPTTINTHNVIPIAHLTPYSNKWVICARVTGKGDIRKWSNARGEGHLFSFELLDESGEIRCTAFKAECDKYYDMIEVNKVYYLSKGSLKAANKQYCGSINHDFEITLNSDSIVEPCADTGSIPGMQFNFVPISDLQNMDKTGLVDVLGICKDPGTIDKINSRKLNKELTKRDVKLVDQSSTEVTLTLWGSQAENFDGTANPVVAVKGAKLSDFNGCSLGSVSSTKIQLNPDIDAAFKLKGWFDREGHAAETTSISTKAARSENFMALEEAKLKGIGSAGDAGYYSACVTVLQVRSENCLYQSCPNGDCKKKVLDQQNGMFRCEKCNQEFPEFRWRLLMQMNVADMTGNQWVTAFQEQAETVLGIAADELGRKRDTDDEGYQQVFRRTNFKRFNFTMRAKMETYNEENRLRVVVVSASAVKENLEAHKKRLEAEIAAMGGSLADI